MSILEWVSFLCKEIGHEGMRIKEWEKEKPLKVWPLSRSGGLTVYSTYSRLV